MAGKEHFVFYDFADPENFRDDIKGTIDRLLIDPPFKRKLPNKIFNYCSFSIET